MTYLARVKYKGDYVTQTQLSFKGLCRTDEALDGDITDMTGMSFRADPILQSEAKPNDLVTLSEPQMLAASEGKLCYIDGGDLYCIDSGSQSDALFAVQPCASGISEGEKQFCFFGKRLIIMPDKLCFDIENEVLTPLEEDFTGGVEFCDGTLYGEPCEANTVKSSTPFPFKTGDGVSFIGSGINCGQTLIIREISGDKKELRFNENSFTVGTADSIEIKRAVPDMDCICVCSGRLWGAKGNTVYASKAGDPCNFNVFDGLYTDSYALELCGEGEFTACCEFLGYPTFFKENAIVRIYGSRPSNYAAQGTPALGVKKGCPKSLQYVTGRLIYLSPAGFCSYTGGNPTLIGECLGEGSDFGNAVSVSDGRNYHTSVTYKGMPELLDRNGKSSSWYKTDDSDAVDMAMVGQRLFLLSRLGELRVYFDGSYDTNDGFSVEFSDMKMHELNKKMLSKLELCYSLSGGADTQNGQSGEDAPSLTVEIMYDGDGTYRTVAVWQPDNRQTGREPRTRILPIVPRRAERIRLRLRGKGNFRLYGITRTYRDSTTI